MFFFLFLGLPFFTAALSSQAPHKSKFTQISQSPSFETLKFGGKQPDFDVLAKTKDWIGSQATPEGVGEDIYDKNCVMRAPVVGPLVRKDLRETVKGFDIQTAFPDLQVDTFGFTIDPENPFRCFYFQRWRGTNTGPLQVGMQTVEPTGNYAETPVAVFTVVWTPEQQIIYTQVGTPVDRFEGNTGGKSIVFGLLHAAGVKLPSSVGDPQLRALQRLGHVFNSGGRSFSREEDIPSWWKSKARGADETDEW
jgi:hypothetical protein